MPNIFSVEFILRWFLATSSRSQSDFWTQKIWIRRCNGLQSYFVPISKSVSATNRWTCRCCSKITALTLARPTKSSWAGLSCSFLTTKKRRSDSFWQRAPKKPSRSISGMILVTVVFWLANGVLLRKRGWEVDRIFGDLEDNEDEEVKINQRNTADSDDLNAGKGDNQEPVDEGN